MIRAPILLLALTLSACGSGDDSGVGGVSAGEARALNEAAARLDARPGANVQALAIPTAPNAAQ